MGTIWEWEKVVIVCFFKGWGENLLWTVEEKEAAVGVSLTRTEQVKMVLKICLCIRLVE